MKRILTVLAVMVALVALTSQLWAQGPRGAGRGMGSQVTPEQRQQFLDETASLRESLSQKQEQVRNLLAAPDSDPAQIGILEKEMYQLRQQIGEKAQAAGMPCGGYGAGNCVAGVDCPGGMMKSGRRGMMMGCGARDLPQSQ